MKILSIQPASLYQNGGMGRLLRRLYKGHEKDIIGLYVNNNSSIKKGEINEISISAFPIHRPWMRWKIRGLFKWLRESLFYNLTKYKVERAVSKIQFDVLHIINHGPFSAILCNEKTIINKHLWTSFHDHFSLCSTFKDAQKLWNLSDRRLMISQELGEEYQRIFGFKDFELITDGVSQEEISLPRVTNQNQINIYFSGLLHLDYYPLFKVLIDALDILVDQGHSFKLILRGTREIKFLKTQKFKIDYRSNFISDEEIKKELDMTDILYLPIKFTLPNFYLYSLSTKMISYIGAAGKILFHGPSESAACKLLQKNNAAISCVSLNVEEMVSKLKEIINIDTKLSLNANNLAKSRFELTSIQKTFWKYG
jgi:glycosyltransferase involved in cell wall biosynthesis